MAKTKEVTTTRLNVEETNAVMDFAKKYHLTKSQAVRILTLKGLGRYNKQEQIQKLILAMLGELLFLNRGNADMEQLEDAQERAASLINSHLEGE